MVTSARGPETILQELALLPTAPFHEEQVAGYVQRLLAAHQVPSSLDPYGNVIAHYLRGSALQPLALVAHMDHPAFEIVASDGRRHQAALLGGVLNPCFTTDTPVRIYRSGGPLPGRITGLAAASERGSTFLTIEAQEEVAVGDWGVWEMTDYRKEGSLLHLRAADDLAGCAVLLATLLTLQHQGIGGDVYGVFTRAEEVGLLGATLVAQERLLPAQAIIISVESSRALPGAELGAGPVIRVGDFRRTFHPEAEAFLLVGWEALRRADPTAKVQRQLLSGGTCEATAFSLFGYRTTGVALPLGNYHNMGPNTTLAPEYIQQDDLTGAVALLTKTVEAAHAPLEDPLRSRYIQAAAQYQERLGKTARRWT